MKLRHLAAVALVAAVSLGQPLSDGSDLVGEVDASAGAGAIELNEAASAERSGGASRAPAPDPELTEYLRTDLCNPPSPTMPGLCAIAMLLIVSGAVIGSLDLFRSIRAAPAPRSRTPPRN